MRPVIGITANYTYDGAAPFAEGIGAREQQWQLLANDYITSVMRAGGLPLILPLFTDDCPDDFLAEMLSKVDGLIFSGGNDVDPQLFQEKSQGKTGPVIPERDEQELRLLDLAYTQTNKPVLCICRGIQLLNVYFGGTLIQDIPSEGYGSHTLSMYPRNQASHRITTADGSLLQSIVQDKIIGVNSFHHMAVKDCAPVLTVTARAEDGIIEAVELKNNPEKRFLLGVQWHPEMMWDSPVQQGIFQTLVNYIQKE